MAGQMVKTFKALADQNRLHILAMLFQEPLFVCEISKMLEIAFSTTSAHLTILRNAGLITDAKQGKWVKCTIDNQSTNPYAPELIKLLKQWLGEESSFQQGIDSILMQRPDSIC